VSSVEETTHADRASAKDTIAGLLAVASIVLSGIAMGFGLLLQLDARPARLAPVAILLALVAARMSDRFESLALKAALFAAFALVVGMTVAIVTDGPLL
jgi:FtsH-binding integral membrane protein